MSNLRARSAVSPLRRRIADASGAFVPALPNVDALVAALRPEEPVHCIRPAVLAATAAEFINPFPATRSMP
jgi:ornithine decarboxylase